MTAAHQDDYELAMMKFQPPKRASTKWDNVPEGAIIDNGQVIMPAAPPEPPSHVSAGFAPLEASEWDSTPAPQAAPTEAAGAAGDGAWPELVPLPEDTDSTEPPGAFPFSALGYLLGSAAQGIAEDVQAPDAMAGGSVLAAASLAVQALADVVTPHGQVRPLSLYLVTSGSSGDRKSAVDDVACMEIGKRRKEQSRQHHHAMEAFKQEQAAWKKGDPEPVEPLLQSLTVGNATVEGVSRLLKSQSHIGIFSPEGGEVLGGHSMKEVNRMGAMAFFLKGWGGESLDVMRGGNGYTSLLGRRMALHIMVQPLLLRQLLSDPLADGQGFLARCLIAQPQTLAGTRMFRDCNPMQNPAALAYAERMGHLLDTKPQLWPNSDGYELNPKQLHLDPQARALWIHFYNTVEAQQADGKDLELARAFASKVPEQAARIAGVITLFSDPHAHLIDEAAMFGAMELMQFYLSEHVRLMGTGRQEQADKRLRALWDWLQTQGPIVSSRHIAQAAPRAVRNLKSKGIAQLLDELTQRGYVRPMGKTWEVRNVD
jgi:putative DNA primase/helicase